MPQALSYLKETASQTAGPYVHMITGSSQWLSARAQRRRMPVHSPPARPRPPEVRERR